MSRLMSVLKTPIAKPRYSPCLRFYSSSPPSSDTLVPFPLFSHALNSVHQDKIAFTDFCGRDLTFSHFGSKSIAISKQIDSLLSTHTEERVALLLDRDTSFPISLAATWWSGHVAVPLAPAHPKTTLEYFLNETSAKLIITNGKYADLGYSLETEVKTNILVIDCDKLRVETVTNTDTYLDPARYLNKNALILFTSGTTGKPKGVLLTHSNIYAQVANICDSFELCGKDTLLHTLPLHHTHGLIHAMISPLAVTARCHMLEKFDPGKVWKELLSLDGLRPNVLMGVPTVYVKLIEECEKSCGKRGAQRSFVKEICSQRMRLFLSGSASLPVPVINKFEEITGHRILERYGMTELGVILTNPLHGERKPGFVGNPMKTVEISVANLQLEKYVPVAYGNTNEVHIIGGGESITGDLLVKGPSVFKEYWRNPEATEKDFTNDGWFITGDVVEYAEQSFKVLGRKSVDIIKRGGYKLSALEIETSLLSLPEVKEVAVLGIDDPTWGQKVVAVVVWSDKELTVNELIQLAKGKLVDYACPKEIKSVARLPRNHLGKVNKKELAKLWSIKGQNSKSSNKLISME